MISVIRSKLPCMEKKSRKKQTKWEMSSIPTQTGHRTIRIRSQVH